MPTPDRTEDADCRSRSLASRHAATDATLKSPSCENHAVDAAGRRFLASAVRPCQSLTPVVEPLAFKLEISR